MVRYGTLQSLQRARVAVVDHAQKLRARDALVLGLDVSVRGTGLAVLDCGGRLVTSHVVVPPSTASVLSAGALVGETLRSTLPALGGRVVETGVEDFARAFKESASTTQSRFTMARMNGIAAYEAWVQTEGGVVFHYPTTMRSYFGVGAAAAGGEEAAAEVEDGDLSTPSPQQLLKRKGGRTESKSLVLQHVSRIFPALVDHARDFEAAHGLARGSSRRAKGAPAVDRGTSLRLRATAFDRADAVLTAMYTLSSHLEWRTLTQDSGEVFAALVAEALPTARLGRGTIADADRPAIQAALLRLHAIEMREEARRRQPYVAGCGASASVAAAAGGEADAGEAAEGKRSSKRMRALRAVQSPAGVDEEAASRLYWRLRDAFASTCRDSLVDDVFHWER